jgi:hypothetical protein
VCISESGLLMKPTICLCAEVLISTVGNLAVDYD